MDLNKGQHILRYTHRQLSVASYGGKKHTSAREESPTFSFALVKLGKRKHKDLIYNKISLNTPLSVNSGLFCCFSLPCLGKSETTAREVYLIQHVFQETTSAITLLIATESCPHA